ncbi:MAG: CtsR family transcriptional regulator [Clostridia bacterium]|jgi:transcriptional regulator CtsR|nr:CtsR family transcriptional regulator [Clostridia bacterium]NLV34860.1 CtsR family transcriptional regulator [Clostridiaceae bacterium]MDD4502328.1 CtsR family transcriptional regulator [Clostridia bacterium]HPB17573.1 CtsR family transcriptional regulator [Clostridia bacterium]HQM95457.1 CtsR family transcriptional regulator [Clostridia bacterium]
MARLSDIIENFIKDMIEETDGEVEIQRNELASYFNCVPSQINYVIATRFNSERGYFVESKRGGGGHITISRMSTDKPYDYFMHIILSMGDEISQHSADIYIENFIDLNIISESDKKLLKAAVNDNSLKSIPVFLRDRVRADILKNMLMKIII